MRRRKQDFWMSSTIVLKDTKTLDSKDKSSVASGNKNRNLYQRCGLCITC